MKACIWRGFLFLFPLLFLFSFPVSAETDAIRDAADTDRLYEHLPSDWDREKIKSEIENNDTTLLVRRVINGIGEGLNFGLKKASRLFLLVTAVLLVGAAVKTMKGSFSSTLAEAFDLILLPILAVLTLNTVEDSFLLVQETLSYLHVFMGAGLATTGMLHAMSGAIMTANVQKTALTGTLTVASAFLSTVLKPLICALYGMSLTESFSTVSLGSLSAFLKKTVKLLCTLFFTLMGGLLALQNALSSAGDSLAMRGVRFAAGNFIPVVGPLVGEASRTLAASLTLVRTQCGILCLLTVLYVLFFPVLTLTVHKFALVLCAALGEMLDEKRAGSLLRGVAGILDLMVALMISEGVFFVFYLALMITSRGGMG